MFSKSTLLIGVLMLMVTMSSCLKASDPLTEFTNEFVTEVDDLVKVMRDAEGYHDATMETFSAQGSGEYEDAVPGLGRIGGHATSLVDLFRVTNVFVMFHEDFLKALNSPGAEKWAPEFIAEFEKQKTRLDDEVTHLESEVRANPGRYPNAWSREMANTMGGLAPKVYGWDNDRLYTIEGNSGRYLDSLLDFSIEEWIEAVKEFAQEEYSSPESP